MDVFFETAAKHFAKNPTSETADLILSLGGAIQTQLSKTKDAETQTSPQREMAGVASEDRLRGKGRGLIQRRDGWFCPKNEFIWIGDTREKHREAEEMFEDAEEIDYENDRDTSVYLEAFGDVLGEKYPPIPDWFGENKTYFFPWNLPKGYWENRKYFNEDNRTDVGLVFNILKVTVALTE